MSPFSAIIPSVSISEVSLLGSVSSAPWISRCSVPLSFRESSAILSSFQDGQLSCIGQDIEEIPESLIQDYSKVTRRLDLSFNRIKSVNGLEEFLNLEELVLDNNNINTMTSFPHLAHLHTLTLNKNKLTKIEDILDNIEQKFPQLTYLSLLGNTACPNQLSCRDKDEEDYIRYRHYVLYRLPRLKFLDSSPVKSCDLEEAKRVGPFMKMVRGSEDNLTEEAESPPSPTNYTPLPDSRRKDEQHLSSFGKSKYVYYGKHSEGNRFIRNTDL